MPSAGSVPAAAAAVPSDGGLFHARDFVIRDDDTLYVTEASNGVINILDASTLIHQSPKLYACFLIWLLAELFENLPEAGDADRPKFVLFFDEADLLFDDAPKALFDRIEQVVRRLRSKGVGVYFISQSPMDIPEDILGQLGMKIQHALRAFTPKDKRVVKAAAASFRQNPSIDTETLITELGVGEALVSVLDEDGKPTPVEHVYIKPPESRIGPLTDQERKEHLSRSPYKGRYDEVVDRESAYEMLKQKAEQLAEAAERESKTKPVSRSRRRQSPTEAMINSAARSMGSQIGRQIMRGILGSLFGRR